MLETENQKREIQRWSRLAVQLNGQVDNGCHDHITTEMVLRELAAGRIFDFLHQELPEEVWHIAKLTDVDQHKLSQEWKLIDIHHAVIPR